MDQNDKLVAEAMALPASAWTSAHRAAVSAQAQAVLEPQQPVTKVPMPAGAPSNLTADQQLTLSTNWAEHVLDTKNPGDWTVAEREAVRAAIHRTLRQM